MKTFKIFILYDFKKGAWGGGNQFLKALRNQLALKGQYTNLIKESSVILINSHHKLGEGYRIKKSYPDKIVIYRIDGPISLTRDNDYETDQMIFLFNKLFADGLIFQSDWSCKKNKDQTEISSKYEVIIHNSSDDQIFNQRDRLPFNHNKKTKIIAISWSSNWKKGFKIYKFLDDNLDFSKYQMTFVGNSPIEFKNIKKVDLIPSTKISSYLKSNDIYITASQNEACSNSLIEALSCGLPAIVLNDGGNPELVQKGGLTFENEKNVIKKIIELEKDYYQYKAQIPNYSITKTSQEYYNFALRIFNDIQQKRYKPKVVNFITRLEFKKLMILSLKKRFRSHLKSL